MANNTTKQHQQPSMDTDYLNTIKDLATNVGLGLNYTHIRDRIISTLSSYQFKTAGSGSAYINVPAYNRMYATFRISNHFPRLSNLANMSTDAPTDNVNGNISLMFFGSTEADEIINNAQVPYKMTPELLKIKVKRNTYNIKKHYRNGSTIKYKIYHYISNYLTDADVDLISKASGDWLHDGGRIKYFPPEVSENAFEGEIVCDAVFDISSSYQNNVSRKMLNEDEVYAEGGAEPLMVFYFGLIIYFDEETGEELDRVNVWFRILSCPANMINVIRRVYKDMRQDYPVYNTLSDEQKKELVEKLSMKMRKLIQEEIDKL